MGEEVGHSLASVVVEKGMARRVDARHVTYCKLTTPSPPPPPRHARLPAPCSGAPATALLPRPEGEERKGQDDAAKFVIIQSMSDN